jgi:hypothetical protein
VEHYAPSRRVPTFFFKPTLPKRPPGSSTKGGDWQRPQRAEHLPLPASPHGLPPTARAIARVMTATSKAPRRPRIRARGPLAAPTPIRTARGSRSAAADDRILAEFLETSLHVPNLTLPPQNRKRFQFPPPPPELPGVSAQALLPGESSAAAVIAAAESSGAFSVDTAVYASDVREAVEASKALFAAPEEVKRELER